MGCRTFYDQLIQVDQINRQEKWMNEVGYINDQKWNKYNFVTKGFKDFQYKLIITIFISRPSYIE